MKKLTFNVQVTKKDILKGIQQDCHECPVALAVARTFKSENVSVGGDSIEVETENGEFFFHKVPKKVQKFIEKFDDIGNRTDRQKLKPFSFKLSI
jgi:hypothetical protein